jgi:adenine-specific DNA-methyltransferase
MTILIEKLKEIFPTLFNGGDKLDVNALQYLLGQENITSYELNFAGKEFAKAKKDIPTQKELKVELKQSKNFDATNNVIIRGDNLDALKHLKQAYTKQIKMIYIDPPYNTGGDALVYNDTFKFTEDDYRKKLGLNNEEIKKLKNFEGKNNHSAWLSFMYPRLALARDLLRDDGAIFISIDDNEQANLKLLCDEIYGEENFVVTFNWQTKKSAQGMTTKNLVVNNHEYILVYAKRKSNFKFLGEERDKENGFINPDNDSRGLWKRQYLQRLGQNLPKRTIIDPQTKNSFTFETPYTQEKLELWIRENRIIFPKTTNKYPARKEFMSEYENKKQLVLGIYAWVLQQEQLVV